MLGFNGLLTKHAVVSPPGFSIVFTLMLFGTILVYERPSNAQENDAVRAFKLRESGDLAKVREAQAIFQRLRQGKTAAKQVIFYGISSAICNYRLGNADSAISELQDLINRYPDNPDTVLVHGELGIMFREMWKVAEAEHHLHTALQLHSNNRKLSAGDTARLRVERAINYVTQGRHDTARTEFEELRMLDSVRAEPASMLLVCNNYLATLDLRENRPYEAIERLKESLKECEQTDPPTPASVEARFTCHIMLAQCFRDQTRFVDSISQLESAKQVLKRNASLLGTLKLRDRTLEQESQAITTDVDAIQVALETESRQSPELLIDRLNDIQVVATTLIEKLRSEGSAKKKSLGESQNNVGHILLLKGAIYQRLQNDASSRHAFQSALEYLSDAHDSFSELGRDLPQLLEIRRARASVLHRLQETEAAVTECRDLLAEVRKVYGDDKLTSVPLLELLVDLETTMGNFDSAASYAQRSRRILHQYLLHHAAGLTPATLQRLFRRWDDPSLHAAMRLGVRNEQYAEQSAEWLLNGKAKSAEVSGKIIRSTLPSHRSIELRRTLERQSYLLYGEQRQRTLTRLFDLEAERRKTMESQVTPLDDRWYKVTDVQGQLSENEVFIDVFCLRDEEQQHRYFAWVVTNNGKSQVVSLGAAQEIDMLIDAMLDDLENFNVSNNGDYAEAMKNAELRFRRMFLEPLSAQILEPLLSAAEDRTNWIISPDGALWNLPWSALILPDARKHCLERLQIRQVFSGREVAMREASIVQSGPNALVLADPDYDLALGMHGEIERSLSERALPLQSEGEAISNVLRKNGYQVSLCGGPLARKDAILNLKQAPRLLYVATHGKFIDSPDLRVDDPFLCCFLAFAGYNRLPPLNSSNATLPGVMTGAEVVLSNLQGTELVVLSACQTGRGIIAQGHSSASLRHAFHLAGARSVVASSWSVADDATAMLMANYMKQIKLANVDKAEALRLAQLEMMFQIRQGALVNGPTPGQEYPVHPFYWAAFSLSGL